MMVLLQAVRDERTQCRSEWWLDGRRRIADRGGRPCRSLHSGVGSRSGDVHPVT